MRLAGDDVHARGESTISAVVGDLNREIKRDSERDRCDVKDREQRMLRQITKNVPAEETEVLRDQTGKFARGKRRAIQGLARVPPAGGRMLSKGSGTYGSDLVSDSIFSGSDVCDDQPIL